ncbi:MAG TPA: hypothetical protein VFW28_01565 [Micropepsaceae bacterium]|nr:hypothetical protein [Micropepsaceae bacterium]
MRVENISQLFDTLDPFPFPERDLDSDAEEYIVGWARELPHEQPIRLIVHVTGGQATEQESSLVGTALNRYFEYRAGIISRDLNELFRVGRTALLIGLSVLALCLVLAQFTARRIGDTELGQFLQQSLIILGWVANWKPIETFLYAGGRWFGAEISITARRRKCRDSASRVTIYWLISGSTSLARFCNDCCQPR